MTRDALLALSKEDLVALVLAQQARIEALTAQVAALTEQVAALQARRPAQDPRQRQHAPLAGREAQPPRSARPAPSWSSWCCPRLGRTPGSRHRGSLTACPHCAHPLGPADQAAIHA